MVYSLMTAARRSVQNHRVFHDPALGLQPGYGQYFPRRSKIDDQPQASASVGQERVCFLPSQASFEQGRRYLAQIDKD
jgi:hypothetical protein